jgi:hypothetical protein
VLDFYCDGDFKLSPGRGKCISILGDYGEKWYFSGINDLHITF